jgi:hypothetical protein
MAAVMPLLACESALGATPINAAHLAVRPAATQSQQLSIELFDATYRVAADGEIMIEERITFRFEGQWRGVIRSIPVESRLGSGDLHEIYLHVISVTDDQGNALRHEVLEQGRTVNVRTWIPGAQDTVRTVVYSYRVENGLRYASGDEGALRTHDELYWNVTGDEWEMPIRHARATVQLPLAVTGVQAIAYTGPRGARNTDYDQVIAESTVYFETTQPLGNREGLTVLVGWNPGAVAPPAGMTRLRWRLTNLLRVPLPMIAFFAVPITFCLAMLWLWWRRRWE